MTETRGQGRAALVASDVEFDERDHSLLRAIDETGSVARAATNLGRSRARALNRIEMLESAFGTLVERQRGGAGGGGSQLTDQGRALLDRFDRLAVAIEATATVPETVVRGSVVDVDGELALVETPLGELRGMHDGLPSGATVQVRIGADAVTVHAAGEATPPDATSARNRLRGEVVDIEAGETVRTLLIDGGPATIPALVTQSSMDKLNLGRGDTVEITWKATATRITAGAGTDNG